MNVYVYCQDSDIPTGGVNVLYKLVDTLNRMGLRASMVHDSEGFRCTWFDNRTPVVTNASIIPDATDLWVIPEIYMWRIGDFAPGCRKVVFNQNCYLTFHGFPLAGGAAPDPYRHPDVVGVTVVSEDSKRYLEYAFPGLKIHRLHYEIDQSLFSYQPDKKRWISFMPRKNREDAIQVVNMLRARGSLESFDVVPIEGKSMAEVGAILRDTLIFLSFGYPEGCGLPPAEAMSCGCVAIGYHGMGGREYFDTAFSYPVEHGEIVAYVRAVEKVLELYRRDPEILAERGRMAAAFISERFSREAWERDVRGFFSEIL